MSETTVSVLTPPGKSALAVLGLAGPRAWDVARAVFAARADLPDAPEAGRFWLGRVGDDVRDDAVLAVRDAGRVELHVHGGREVVRWLLELIAARGVPAVPWQEQRASPLADVLSRAATVRTAAIALDQYVGPVTGDPSRWSDVGAHLARPWRVVLAGAPNAGKSSLLNALAGYQRSVVAPTPGTTRDVVTLTLALDGWPVEFADTAGLRDADDAIEGQGVALAREAIAGADLCLWLLDATATPTQVPTGALAVVNKIDQPAAWDLARAGDAPRVSAVTGEGLAGLCEAVVRRLVPEVPPPGAAVAWEGGR